MAKRQIHYQSAEYYRIKFLRSIVIALLIIIITMIPMVLMLNVLSKGSTVMTIIIGCCLTGFFALQVKTNYSVWQDKKKEEERSHKKVHRKAPAHSR